MGAILSMRWFVGLLMLLGVAVGVACSSGSAASGTVAATGWPNAMGTVTVTPTATIVTGRQAVYEKAIATVRQYLDTWAADGQRAANRFVVPEMRVAEDASQLTLLDGTVTGYMPSCWESSDDFTLFVQMNLHFKDGDGFAFHDGYHAYFVMFSRSSPDQSLVMSSWAPAPGRACQ